MKWILLVLIALTAPFSVASKDIIRVSYIDYKPFTSPELPQLGFLNDIIVQAFRLEGITVDFVHLSPTKAYHSIVSGDIDASSGWTKNQERQQHAIFSDPIYTSNIVLFSRKNDPILWPDFPPRKHIKMGITKNYFYGAPFATAINSKKFSIQSAMSDKVNLKKLVKRRIDAFPLSVEVGLDMLQQGDLRLHKKELIYSSKPVTRDLMSLMVSKKTKHGQHFVTAFNRGLKKLKASGDYQKIIEQTRVHM